MHPCWKRYVHGTKFCVKKYFCFVSVKRQILLLLNSVSRHKILSFLHRLQKKVVFLWNFLHTHKIWRFPKSASIFRFFWHFKMCFSKWVHMYPGSSMHFSLPCLENVWHVAAALGCCGLCTGAHDQNMALHHWILLWCHCQQLLFLILVPFLMRTNQEGLACWEEDDGQAEQDAHAVAAVLVQVQAACSQLLPHLDHIWTHMVK